MNAKITTVETTPQAIVYDYHDLCRKRLMAQKAAPRLKRVVIMPAAQLNAMVDDFIFTLLFGLGFMVLMVMVLGFIQLITG